MKPQRRVLYRDDPPIAWFVVGEVAAYRCVGSPQVMAEQTERLASVARLPNVTVFVIADDSAWCENVKGSYVYTGKALTPCPALFDTLRGECLKVSETTALFERMTRTWNRLGARAATATRTADSASRSQRTTE
jgi:hypothetical protein